MKRLIILAALVVATAASWAKKPTQEQMDQVNFILREMERNYSVTQLIDSFDEPTYRYYCERYIDTIIANGATTPIHYIQLARTCLERKHLGDAIRVYNLMVDNGAKPNAYEEIADAYSEMNVFSKAAEYYDRLLPDSSLYDYWATKIECLFYDGNYEAAERELDQYIAQKGERRFTNKILSQLYFMQGKYSEAQTLIRDRLNNFSCAEDVVRLAECYMALGDSVAAMDLFASISELDKHPSPYNLIAFAYLSFWNESTHPLRNLLTYPSQQLAIASLDEMQSDREWIFRLDAVRQAMDTINISPYTPRLMAIATNDSFEVPNWTIAALYSMAGDTVKALSYLEKALANGWELGFIERENSLRYVRQTDGYRRLAEAEKQRIAALIREGEKAEKERKKR